MTNTSKKFLDFPVVTLGEDNPYRVEVDHTAEMKCRVTWAFSDHLESSGFENKIMNLSRRDKAEDCGEYVCNSYNFMHPSGRGRQKRENNATVCHADPLGYTEPT